MLITICGNTVKAFEKAAIEDMVADMVEQY